MAGAGPDERHRLSVLGSYDLIDAPPDALLAAISRTAAYIAGTRIAEINIIDEEHQHTIAAAGREPGRARRVDAICPRVVESGEPIYTPNALADVRLRATPFVDGTLGQIRRYTARPLRTVDGVVLGTVCAWDETPGEISPTQLELLDDLAVQIVALFEARRLARWFAHDATHDPLTGLANRALLADRLGQLMSRRAASPTTIAAVDLTRFKAVNDEYGHAVGDQVLVEVARRLRSELRPEDLVARLGGDEFVLVIEQPSESAPRLLQRLRECFATPVQVVRPGGAALQLAIGASIGLALAREHESAAAVLAAADEAMYADKRASVTIPGARDPHAEQLPR